MILCVNLSPCLETNIEVDSLAVGKMHKVISRHTYFTGKAMNVAVGLSRLGESALASGFMYEGNGRLFEHEMHKEGVTYKFVWNGGTMKEVYKFIDARSMLTEVVDDASPIEKGKCVELINTVSDLSKNCKAVVLSGDLPESAPEDLMCKILEAVNPKAFKVVDTGVENLSKLLERGVDLIKPNLVELERALNVRITDKNSLSKACDEIIKRGARRLLVSLGSQGAVMCDGKKKLYCTSVHVPMNSTAGAGDAMVAGATKALCDGASSETILRCGVAAGTASVTTPDNISFLRDKYEEILNSLTVKEI